MVNENPLWRITVSVWIEAEEAVASLMEDLYRQSPVLYTDDETLVTQVTVYCRDRRAWNVRRRAQLDAGLRKIRAEGLQTGRLRVSARCVRERNWAQAWKRHFKPLLIEDRLLVRPSWSRRRAKPGQVEVVLDPGLSFGTGHHPTTAFCLGQLVECSKAGQAGAFLDMGTGSGILAIAAAKLGYGPVEAFDFDAAAVRAARQNLKLNGVERSVRLERRDLTRMPLESRTRYDLICANLLDDLLVSQVGRIRGRLRTGGRLVLAGILARQFPRVQDAYETSGLKLLNTNTVQGWQSGSFG